MRDSKSSQFYIEEYYFEFVLLFKRQFFADYWFSAQLYFWENLLFSDGLFISNHVHWLPAINLMVCKMTQFKRLIYFPVIFINISNIHECHNPWVLNPRFSVLWVQGLFWAFWKDFIKVVVFCLWFYSGALCLFVIFAFTSLLLMFAYIC